LAGASLSFQWGKKPVDLGMLLDEIDAWAKKHKQLFLLALDEIQLVRGDKYLPRLLARVADTNRNTVTIITGSEIGLLYDFLGFDKPESPLFGRHFVEIKMSNFSPDQAKEFLKAGFKQINMECSDELANYAVEKLDGIAGWLTLFGLKSRDSKMCSKQVVDETLDTGGKLSRSEALRIVKFSRRYGVILDFLAEKQEASWSLIKMELDVSEGRKLTNSTVSDLLNRLIKTSLVLKEDGEYRIADPLLIHGLKKEPFEKTT
jgi:AAA+ ATPase superfamily predicted ATPase